MKTKHWQRNIVLLFLSVCGFFLLGTAKVESNFFGNSRELLSTNADYNPTAAWLHALPRRTLNGKSVSTSLFETSSSDYGSALLGFFIFSIFIGAVSLIVGILFCIFRHFDKCGGKDSRDSGYSTAERNLTKTFIIIFGLLQITLIGVGCYGNSQFEPGFTEFFNQASSEAQKQSDLIESIFPRLQNITARTSNVQAVGDFDNDGHITTDRVLAGKTYIVGNDIFRIAILGVSYALVAIVSILGGVAAIFNLPKVSMFAANLSFLTMFVVWVNFAVHFPASVAMSDVCYDVVVSPLEAKIEQRIADGGQYGGLDFVLHCPDYNSTLGTNAWANQLIIESIIKQDMAVNNTNGTITQNETMTYNFLEFQIEELANVQADTLFAGQCRWLLYVFAPLQTSLCGSTLTGLVIVWACSFVQSIFMIIFTFLAIMGYKRFSSQEDDGFF